MYICKDCFHDEELRSEISSNADKEGVCEVCGSRGKLMDFSEFDGFFDTLLSLFSSTDNGKKTIVDIIQDEWNLFKDKEIAKVLLTDFITTHSYDFTIHDIVDYDSEIQERVAVWKRLKASVKGNSRFFTNMDEFVTYNYLMPGDNGLKIGERLYRSRITPAGQTKLDCCNMGCPPKELATAGRANPIGIPYLYLCDSVKTTYFEVRAVYLDDLSVGVFEVSRDLKIIDFTHNVSLFYSYIDSQTPFRETVIKKKVIDAISLDLSKPLRRYDSELEYVPTQLICEYCKRVVGADGITFKSSLHKDGRNYVLFDETAAQCIDVESHEIIRIDIDSE
ncbi:MAG: RES family NAD+ phosphorylase [Bacteroidales bacterium]|nr:RES family NAD+ phosphorylase [Bacteroidales bacterium]